MMNSRRKENDRQVVLLARSENSDLSIYLRNAEQLEPGWHRFARFTFRIVGQGQEQNSHQRGCWDGSHSLGVGGYLNWFMQNSNSHS